MGLSKICDKGYPVSRCRCRKKHDSLTVVPCPGEGHMHSGSPIDINSQVVDLGANEALDRKPCPRCEEMVLVAQFRGEVCDFCADMLEEVDRHSLKDGAR